MTYVRFASVSAAAAFLGTLPYFGICVLMVLGPAAEGGAPAQGVLAFAVLTVIGAALATLLLLLARLRWSSPAQVIRSHLFGWPIAFASLLFLVIAVPAAMGGVLTFLVALAVCAVCGVVGVAAAWMWLRWSYPPNAQPERPSERSPSVLLRT